MNVQATISDMKKRIPDIKDSIVKTTPVYRVLNRRETHRRVVELALALGENRLLKYIGYLNLDKDFVFNGEYYEMKTFTSVINSDFFRAVYMDITRMNKEGYILTILADNNVNVSINFEYEKLKGIYRYKFSIPQINFETSSEIILVSRGVVTPFQKTEYYY